MTIRALRTTLLIEPDLNDEIEKYRFANRINSKNDAFVELLKYAIDANKEDTIKKILEAAK